MWRKEWIWLLPDLYNGVTVTYNGGHTLLHCLFYNFSYFDSITYQPSLGLSSNLFNLLS